MAVTYTILQVEPPSERVPRPGIATVEVDFGDGSPVYTKRMMAPVTDHDALVRTIERWLGDYVPARRAAVVPDRVTEIIGEPRQFSEP